MISFIISHPLSVPFMSINFFKNQTPFSIIMGLEEKGCVLYGKYELRRFLVQGSFSKVYHDLNFVTGENIAMKVL
uniref:Protein kinase domain-containing protein n=1 Tax=Solanum lycopersicum TaxID=4081 RepID=A0A3Q7IVK0_SOLLC